MATAAASKWRGLHPPARALRDTLRPFLWPIVFLTAYLVVDLSWTSAVEITIAGLAETGAYVVLVFAAGIAAGTSGRMFPGNRLAARLEQSGRALAYFAIGSAGAALTAMFVYPCNRLALPFRDANYASWDAALGLHWPEWLTYLGAHPTLNLGLGIAYHSHIIQYYGAYIILTLLNDRQRAAELFWAVSLAGIITCIASGLFPAVGAQTHFLNIRSPWLHDLFAVRQPGPAEFGLLHLVGIVTMPSFHATLAALFIWAARRTGLFGWAVLVLNLAMLAGTPSEGGHYFVDVLAGLGVAVIVIFVVNSAVYREDRRVAALPSG